MGKETFILKINSKSENKINKVYVKFLKVIINSKFKDNLFYNRYDHVYFLREIFLKFFFLTCKNNPEG